MKDFLGTVRAKIIIAILTILLGFMIMAVYTGGSASLFAQVVTIVTMPVQRVSARVAGSVSGFFGDFLAVREVRGQNELLREENSALRRELADYERLKHENEQFRQIIGVMDDQWEMTIETASVIARQSVDRFYAFTIDKGSLNGIKYLDPVMTSDGLVGYVVEVGVTYARVVTILDVTVDVGVYDGGSASGVGVYDSATRDIGIISGTVDLAAQGLCQMEFLPRDSGIAAGHIVLTSGGSLFPRDILVGTVTQVAPNSHGTSLAATIRPAADIAAVKDVVVVTWFKGQGEK